MTLGLDLQEPAILYNLRQRFLDEVRRSRLFAYAMLMVPLGVMMTIVMILMMMTRTSDDDEGDGAAIPSTTPPDAFPPVVLGSDRTPTPTRVTSASP
jgi:hypothetical protein